jgi:hypothetical protein
MKQISPPSMKVVFPPLPMPPNPHFVGAPSSPLPRPLFQDGERWALQVRFYVTNLDFSSSAHPTGI